MRRVQDERPGEKRNRIGSEIRSDAGQNTVFTPKVQLMPLTS
jgi:hypothetical protein